MAQRAAHSPDRQGIGTGRRGRRGGHGEGRRTRRRVRRERPGGSAWETVNAEGNLATETTGRRDRNGVARLVSDHDGLARWRDRHAEIRRRHGAGADCEVLRGPLGEAKEGRAGQLVAAPDDARIARVGRGAGIVTPATRVGCAVALKEGLLVERRTRSKDDFTRVHLAQWRRTHAGLRADQGQRRSTSAVVKDPGSAAGRRWRNRAIKDVVGSATDLALLEYGESRRCELIPTDHGAPACSGHGVLGPDRLDPSGGRVAELYRLGQASVEAVEEVGRARLWHARRNAERSDGDVAIGD